MARLPSLSHPRFQPSLRAQRLNHSWMLLRSLSHHQPKICRPQPRLFLLGVKFYIQLPSLGQELPCSLRNLTVLMINRVRSIVGVSSDLPLFCKCPRAVPPSKPWIHWSCASLMSSSCGKTLSRRSLSSAIQRKPNGGELKTPCRWSRLTLF